MDNSKNLMNNDKSLCLYCDKAFSNINDQGNHVERDHKTVLNKSKGSLRKSERITKNLCSENSPFAACFYCNNKKLIKSDDLESLFQHLLAAHKDIYFGCKCKTRLFDKVSLANHKKNCELSGSGDIPSDEKISEKRKSSKTSSQSKGNVDLKCDNLSENTVINSTTANATATAAAAAAATTNHSVKALPTNAINKKSDRSNVKNSNNKSVVNSNEKRNNNHNNSNSKKSKISSISSSSSSTTSSSSSSKTNEEYTIPLTRQKLKEPVQKTSSHNRSLSSGNNSSSSSNNKKATTKASRSSSSANESSSKNASSIHASSSSSSSPTKVQRTKTAKVISHNSQNNCEIVESALKNEALSTEFDEDFYKNISYNVRVNLNSFIDGKVDRLQLSRPVFDRISACESTGGKQPNEIPNHDEKEIHEATNFELSTPFPALLTAEQYGFGDTNPKNRRQITKNSWKWRWDLIKKYKYVNEGGKIVKKVKQITTGLKDLSQLDMWTQLSMRSRYENLNNQNGTTEFDDGLNDSLSTRMIKTQNIEQLNSILDKRLMPEINIEQLQQTLVKEELVEAEEIDEDVNGHDNEGEKELLDMFKLARVDNTKATNTALSGEWARPRCFVCIDCGQEFDLMKSLNDHKNSEHPYVVSAHYEVVGRENLQHKLYKNLFLPKKALHAKINADAKSLSINSDSKSNEASSSSENSSNFLTDQKEKECSKCMKMIKYSNDIDIYRHILDCIEDRVWMQAKRRNKYRRSRRKTKKTVKKTRLPIDQKKSTSSPIQKDNIEGDNSLSNPPTPKDDQKPIISINPKAKTETYVSDGKANNDGMNIKSFFRVSKTTPNLPQKIVVQMIEMHQNNNHNNSLRHSLRSSTRKQSTITQPNAKDSPETDGNDKTTESNPTTSNEGINVKDETIIIGDGKDSTQDTKSNDISPSPIFDAIKTDIPPALTALQIPDADKTKSLLSPTNSSSSSLVSPTSSSVPKKKKKLNDCIAMLTCKIQEKLGVNFFENTTSAEIFPTEVAAPKKEEEFVSPKNSVNTCIPLPLPLIPLPSHQNITNLNPIPVVNAKIPDVPQTTFNMPEQDEVIDLSIKKRPSEDQIPKDIKCNNVNLNIHDENIEKPDDNQSKPIEIAKANDDDSDCIPKCDEIIKIESTSVTEVKEIESPVKESEKCNEKSDKSQDEACNESSEPHAEPEITKTEEITESFKISISKDLIPNLNEIIENNSVITVNNLKISESERRAFEEQKNRIMQILNKTKKTTPKKAAKKPPPKKQPPKKQAKNSVQVEKKQEEVKDDKVESSIKVPEPTIEISKVDESKTEEVDPKKEVEKEKEPPEKKGVKSTKATAEKAKSTKAASKLANEPEKVPPKPIDEKTKVPEEPGNKPIKALPKASNKSSKVTPKPVNEPTKPQPKPVANELAKAPQKVLYKFPSESPEREPEKPKVEEKPAETAPPTNIQNKIEQAIKTTNRIRCRRLSVVVDPIIHLAPFQNNRKIRLTNNSQQNGLYDLLTNDQLFNAITPQLKDEIKKTCAKVANKAAKNIQNAINEVRAATAKAVKETNKEQPETGATKQTTKSKAKSKAKKKPASKKKKKNAKASAKNNKNNAKKQPEKKVEVVESVKKVAKGKQTLDTEKSTEEEKPIESTKPILEEVKPITQPVKATKSMPKKELKSIAPPAKTGKMVTKEEKPAAKSSKSTKVVPEEIKSMIQSEKSERSASEDEIPINQLLRSIKPIIEEEKTEVQPTPSKPVIIKPSKLAAASVKSTPPPVRAASKSKADKTPAKTPSLSSRASTPLLDEDPSTLGVLTPLPKERPSRSITPLPKEKAQPTKTSPRKGKQTISTITTPLLKETCASSRDVTPLPKEDLLPVVTEAPAPERTPSPATKSPSKAPQPPKKSQKKAPAKSKAKKNNAKQKNQIEEPKIEEEITNEKEEESKVPPNQIEQMNITPIELAEDKPEEKVSLDISLSSDTSNENDIPLAKLVCLSKEKSIKEVEQEEAEKMELDDKELPTESTPLKASNKKKPPPKKASKSKAQSKSRAKAQKSNNSRNQKDDEVVVIDDDKPPTPSVENDKIEDIKPEGPFEFTEDVKSVKDEERIKVEDEKLKKLVEKVKSTEMSNAKASKIEKENLDSMEVFNMNEDSFFNDDNDADEKINDLVNNIINSSELVDSENEKNDAHQKNLGENQTEAACLICKRTFRNEKVLEKHNKTTTHLFKVRRREKRIADQMEKEALKKEKEKKEVELKPNENQGNATSSDETKIFRTKGALKTFENILAYPSNRISDTIYDQPKDFKSVVITAPEIKTSLPFSSDSKLINSFDDDDDDDNNEDLSRKDKIFDSLFSNIENKLQAAAAAANNPAPPLQKFAFPTLTPHDSEVESSSTSWDLKHDADIEWDADNNDNPTNITNAIKEKFPKKNSVKINKSKETAISIPTKSLIMGKIFKKHRDREKQKTPQADAPNNKPGIKNSLDEIFDHLKNSAEIDDKVLTCPSPKTLLKSSGGTFSPHSSHSNDMLETASQSNNNNNNSSSNNNSSNNLNINNNNMYSTKKPTVTSAPDKSNAASSNNSKKSTSNESTELPNKDNNVAIDDEEDGIGKRKSRRRCAIKTKTFAETWSSDEYEELHDTNDIISIINEIEKRESIKKRKVSKSESSHFVDSNVCNKKSENVEASADGNHNQPKSNSSSILKSSNESNSATADKKSLHHQTDKNEKKKSVQLQFPTSDIFSKEKPVNTIRKRRMSTLKDGHKSDEETFTATKDLKPLKPTISMMKKRRMSCFVPSSIFNDNPKPQTINKTVKSNANEILGKTKHDKEVEHKGSLGDATCEKTTAKNQKKILSAVCNNSSSSNTTVVTQAPAPSTVASISTTERQAKKKAQKHRKRPRNKVKNIAYDSDSDFELNLSRKSKASAFSDSYSEEEEDGEDISHSNNKPQSATSQNSSLITKCSNTNELTMIKEPKLLPNDLNVVPTTTPAKAAIPEDINDPSQSACNRTKRHSSEKLYYWSSSSESDVEPGDTADGENEDSMIPQQPEQHGWIVGDSHKKLVTLLAHAKIKNKIN